MLETMDVSLDAAGDVLRKYYKAECKNEGLRDDVTYVMLEFESRVRGDDNPYELYKRLC